MLTKVLALELAGHGITANAVSHGMTASDRNAELLGSWKQDHPIVQANPTKRGASTEGAAYPVLFLSSDFQASQQEPCSMWMGPACTTSVRQGK